MNLHPSFLALMGRSCAVAIALLMLTNVHAQLLRERAFTRSDSLRGSLGPYRTWWDVARYDIRLRPDLLTRSLQGRTTIQFRTVTAGQRMQIDLQQPLEVDSITTDASMDPTRPQLEHTIPFERDGHVIWVELPEMLAPNTLASITVYYHGKPRVARNPPWDGGWIWTTDDAGWPWASVACQGLGASVWYPCKDHQSDKAERAALSVVVPDTLVAVANGRLRGTTKNTDGTRTWHWVVNSPISTYNLVPYIGNYVHFHAPYAGENGHLDLDHWVLAQHEEKARVHFQQVGPMLDCFEHWLGPYPFPRDGYKLVEAPHLGMEHQSAIAYGNGFQNGYRGRDLSGTGHGLVWDYIIVHESGHEWFGNNITVADIADLWVHEGFTMYTEVLMTECLLGPEAATDYVVGLRRNVQNDRPLIGPYGVNQEGSGDMYAKGANLVHMVRQLLNDDTAFRQMLRYMNQRFRHAVVTNAQVEDFLNAHLVMDLAPVLDQYLRSTDIPVLEWYVHKERLHYRWTNCLPYFEMPVRMGLQGREPQFRSAGTGWRMLPEKVGRKDVLEVDRAWYVEVRHLDRQQLKAMGLRR